MDEPIPINIGVVQGGKFSPLFFNIALGHILTSNPTTKGIIDKERLLAYADDIIILVEENVKEAIEVVETLKGAKLKINREKCYYMGN
jgi:hypothetical protein